MKKKVVIGLVIGVSIIILCCLVTCGGMGIILAIAPTFTPTFTKTASSTITTTNTNTVTLTATNTITLTIAIIPTSSLSEKTDKR